MSTNKHPSLKYLGLPDDYKPSPDEETIEFLKLHLNQLPPHVAIYFSSLTTPKQRTVLTPIRNRRLAYTHQNPKELRFEYARNTWPELWPGPKPRPGLNASNEEEAWAQKEFLQGGIQHIGKLAKLLGEYEEEREAERARAERRRHVQIDEDFVPEEDSDSEDDIKTIPPQESEQEMKEWFERLIKERFIYGILEKIDYDKVDWDESFNNDNDREEEEKWFDDDDNDDDDDN